MASIVQHKDRWRAQVYVGGIRDSKVFSTESAAREWASGIEERLKRKKELHELLKVGRGIPNFPVRIVEAMKEAELTHDEIVSGSIPVSVICGIYFLVHGKRVVYVGQSINVLRRVARHIDDGKEFDSFSILPCAREDLDRMETIYITALYPKRNRSLGSGDSLVS